MTPSTRTRSAQRSRRSSWSLVWVVPGLLDGQLVVPARTRCCSRSSRTSSPYEPDRTRNFTGALADGSFFAALGMSVVDHPHRGVLLPHLRVPRGGRDQPLPLPRAHELRHRAAARPDAARRGPVHRAVQDDRRRCTCSNSVIGVSIIYIAAVVPFTIWMLRGFVARHPGRPRGGRHGRRPQPLRRFMRITFPLLAPGPRRVRRLRVPPGLERVHGRPRAAARAEASQTLPLWLRGFVQASATRRPTGARSWPRSTLVADPGHHLLPDRAGPDDVRARRRGGEGMTRSTAAAVLLPGFVGTSCPTGSPRVCATASAGSACSARTSRRREQLRALTDAIRAANPLALIAIDEEGGDVTRLYYATGLAVSRATPSSAASTTSTLTAAVAARVARELRAVGVNLNFAPDVDINSNPDNPVIGVRSFGADPAARRPARRRLGRGARGRGRRGERQALPGPRRHRAGLAPRAAGRRPAARRAARARAACRSRPRSQPGARTIMTSHILLPQLDADASRDLLAAHPARGCCATSSASTA